MGVERHSTLCAYHAPRLPKHPTPPPQNYTTVKSPHTPPSPHRPPLPRTPTQSYPAPVSPTTHSRTIPHMNHHLFQHNPIKVNVLQHYGGSGSGWSLDLKRSKVDIADGGHPAEI